MGIYLEETKHEILGSFYPYQKSTDTITDFDADAEELLEMSDACREKFPILDTDAENKAYTKQPFPIDEKKVMPRRFAVIQILATQDEETEEHPKEVIPKSVFDLLKDGDIAKKVNPRYKFKELGDGLIAFHYENKNCRPAKVIVKDLKNESVRVYIAEDFETRESEAIACFETSNVYQVLGFLEFLG
jgi:hypothetical protein